MVRGGTNRTMVLLIITDGTSKYQRGVSYTLTDLLGHRAPPFPRRQGGNVRKTMNSFRTARGLHMHPNVRGIALHIAVTRHSQKLETLQTGRLQLLRE